MLKGLFVTKIALKRKNVENIASPPKKPIKNHRFIIIPPYVKIFQRQSSSIFRMFFVAKIITYK